ncbi:MAG TPA: hypothetical protein P5266_04535 [Candidatus Fermentibacter sp.]|nr:hypothetical protein [Candidatus Fermentibacter sp.]
MAYDSIVNRYLGTLGFDADRSRLAIGGVEVAFHCDKFNTRILKNIEDVMGYEDGGRLLREWAEKTTHESLAKFFKGDSEFAALAPRGRVEAILELFKVLAYGAVSIKSFGDGGAVFSSPYSYLAEGWLENKKAWGWTLRQGPACHDMCGHLAAAMSIAFGKPIGAFTAVETSCRTMDAPECVFEIKGA